MLSLETRLVVGLVSIERGVAAPLSEAALKERGLVVPEAVGMDCCAKLIKECEASPFLEGGRCCTLLDA